jgi:WD40-like Beta Propeller Repeat
MLLAVAKHLDSPAGIPRGRLPPILSSRYAVARASFASGVTLARTSVAGGSVRELAEGILAADLSPDGKQLAVARRVGGATRVEFPLHHVIHELDGWVEDLRFSPSGREVAFVEHPFWGDDAGMVKLAGSAGRVEAVGEPWGSIRGLSWTHGDQGLLVTAGHDRRRLLQLDQEGSARELYDFPPWPVVEDVSPAGEVLLTVHMRRLSVVASSETEERDLSWFDGTFVVDVSADGSLALLGEGRHAAAAIEPEFGVNQGYVRSTRERAAPVHLGPGTPWALSPDGKWAVVSRDSGGKGGLTLVPTGPGEERQLPGGNYDHIELVRFFSDGRRLLILVRTSGRPQLWLQALDDGGSTLAAEGLETSAPPSPDGRRLVVHGPRGWGLMPVSGGSVTPLPGIAEADAPVAWTPDGEGLFVHRAGPPRAEHQARVDLYRMGAGTMHPWRTVTVRDPVGVASLWEVQVCPATGEIFYVYDRELGDLYALTGLDLG